MASNQTDKIKQQYKREYYRIMQAIRRQTKIGYNVNEKYVPKAPSRMKSITEEDILSLRKITPQTIRTGSTYNEPNQVKTETHSAGKQKPKKRKTYSNTNLSQPHTKTQETKQPKPKQPKQPKQPKPKQPRHPKPSKQTRTPNTPQQDTPLKLPLTPPNEPQQDTPLELPFTPPEPSAPPQENNFNLQIIEKISNLLLEWTPEPDWSAYFEYQKTLNRNKILMEWNDLLLSEGEYQVAYRIENKAEYLYEIIKRLLYDSESKEEESIDFGELHEIIFDRPLTAVESDYYNTEATASVLASLRGENSFA